MLLSMIYMTPTSSDISNYPHYWGIISTPSRWSKRITPGRWWCADNEAFTKKFDEGRFFDWLAIMRHYQPTCLFVVCPDVVADPIETRRLFDFYSPKIRELGYRVAFSCQDGQENLSFPDFDALFVGGSTEWKLSTAADDCIRYAQSIGKWVHVGRVNSQRRIRHFQQINVDSVDGTSVCFAPNKNVKCLNKQLSQKPLFYI